MSMNNNTDKRSTISTTNDGRLELTFIGSGSAFGKKYYQNNLLAVKGPDHLLIDCGTRAPEALAALGLSVQDVNTYVITHSHADHVGGLEEVMLLNRYVGKRKCVMVAPAKYRQALWEKSLKGGAAYNERIGGRNLRFSDFWDIIDPVEIPDADRELCECSVGGIELAMFRTMHIPDSVPSWRESNYSYAVVIDKSVLFTSDTRYDPQLIEFAFSRYPITAIFHDCQLYTGGVHASLEELAGLDPAVRAITRLMHYGDGLSDEHHKRATELGFVGFVQQWVPYRF